MKRIPTLIGEETWLIRNVHIDSGKFTVGAMVLIESNLYMFVPGFCTSCDLKGKSCFRKPFTCDRRAVNNVCLKRVKGGL